MMFHDGENRLSCGCVMGSSLRNNRRMGAAVGGEGNVDESTQVAARSVNGQVVRFRWDNKNKGRV